LPLFINQLGGKQNPLFVLPMPALNRAGVVQSRDRICAIAKRGLVVAIRQTLRDAKKSLFGLRKNEKKLRVI
jgi:hypothetical protein